jgi:signal peptidase II
MQRPTSAISLGLIAGGIVGNVVDRIRLGHVVDFLLFYIRQYQWPAFNVADSAICCGVALYVIVSWRTERQAEPTPAS